MRMVGLFFIPRYPRSAYVDRRSEPTSFGRDVAAQLAPKLYFGIPMCLPG